MEFPRSSGVLLHPTCFPGRYGIGDLGDAAYRFIEFLAGSSQQFWQIMPLGPTSYGDSPYQALSAFAGNPLLISLDRLVDQQYLAPWDLLNVPAFSEDAVDYGAVINFKGPLLHLAWENFQTRASTTARAWFASFKESNRAWLDDFALFAALKEYHGGSNWSTWDEDIATRQPGAVGRWRAALSEQIQLHKFIQFEFFRQWTSLKAYANQQGIQIIGDIPIFVAYDSADAWAHPELFYFDEKSRPTLVAGVPPDFFSPTGQRWGNPVYRWDVMANDGYAWWVHRFRTILQHVDVIRLDHFRGFEAYWAVPADEETAENGEWREGPGLDLFHAVERALGPVPIIAEDLGLITPEVEALRDGLGLPGMKVLQFAFSDDPDSPYLPHNYTCNFVVYTGTHDNDTTVGWFHSAGLEERIATQKYLGRHGDDINWDLIRLAQMSVANTAIFPLQDVLGTGSEGRMNTPGRAMGNWSWRYRQSALTATIRDRLKDLTYIYGRAPRIAETEEDEAETP